MAVDWTNADDAMREIARRLRSAKEDQGCPEPTRVNLTFGRPELYALLAVWPEDEPAEECKHLGADYESMGWCVCDECGEKIPPNVVLANLRAALKEADAAKRGYRDALAEKQREIERLRMERDAPTGGKQAL